MTANDTAASTNAAANTDANANQQTSTDNTQGTAAADAAKDAAKDGQQTDASKAADANADAAKADADKGKDAKDAKAKDGDKPKDDKANKDADKTVPEKYEDFALPEDVKLNPETVEKFTGLAKELGLTQAQAQKLADLGAEMTQKVNGSVETALIAKSAELTNKWEGESKSDTEFGGAALDENLSIAKAAVDAFASDNLKSLLGKFDKEKNPNGTGLGNHPEIIRLFYRLGKQISSDKKFVSGDSTTNNNTNVSPADRLWGGKK